MSKLWARNWVSLWITETSIMSLLVRYAEDGLDVVYINFSFYLWIKDVGSSRTT